MTLRIFFKRLAVLLFCCAASAVEAQTAPNASAGGPSLSGPVTSAEIAGVKASIMRERAPQRGGGNVWVYGGPGKAVESCGLMYEVTKDREILDRMIYFCDAALAGRNDIALAAQGGQRLTWAGKIDPVWPSGGGRGGGPIGAGVEQGQVLSHIAYCIRLILETPALAQQAIADGDPHHFGATYHERALRYLKECDHVIDAWILPHFIRVADRNRYYFPGAPNTYKANEPAPWNQSWMLTNGFVRLAQCHALLDDDPARLARYDAIAKPNIEWFLTTAIPAKSAIGSDCRVWPYSLAQPKQIEDTNHAAYDSEGLWIAYASGRYGLTRADIMPFANTYVDIVMGTVKSGRFAGRVNGDTGTGHAGGDSYVRDEYLYLAEFRPDAFDAMAKAEIATRQMGRSLPITARMLWVKDRRNKAGNLPMNH